MRSAYGNVALSADDENRDEDSANVFADKVDNKVAEEATLAFASLFQLLYSGLLPRHSLFLLF